MASKSKAFKKLAEQFTAITGASEDVGRRMLEVCNGNLEMAIGMHLEGQAEEAAAEANDNHGDSIASTSSAATTTNDEDNVRAPIPQKRDILVEGAYAFGPRPRKRGGRGSVFDRFRDFQAEAKAQEERMRNLAEGKPVTKKKTLEDLFRPPIDIMHKGTFDTARETGQSQCKWVLVNVQNVQEFSCQKLNRDVWSSSAVKSIIEEHFVFWQVYHDSEEGQKYTQFYQIEDFPYVAIIDPRTGEKLLEWHNLDSVSFCDLVTEFLSSHPIFDKDGLSPPPKKKARRAESIVDASEDSQLEAAIAASLVETNTEDKKGKRRPARTRPEIFFAPDSEEDSETFHSIDGSSSESDDDDFATGRSSTHSSPVKKCENGESKHSLQATKLKESAGLFERLENKSDSSSEVNAENRTENRTNSGNKTNNAQHNKEDDEVTEQVIVNCDSADSEDENSDSRDKYSEEDSFSLTTEEEDSLNDNGPKAKLMIRFPDGKRKQLSLPASAKLMTLVKLVISEGYSNERYELVTNFPRRKLSYLDFDITLQEAGLFPQETVFVQER